jgi:hypothetical protein
VLHAPITALWFPARGFFCASGRFSRRGQRPIGQPKGLATGNQQPKAAINDDHENAA